MCQGSASKQLWSRTVVFHLSRWTCCLNQSEMLCVIIAVRQMVKETTIADSQEREWMIAVHNGHHLRM